MDSSSQLVFDLHSIGAIKFGKFKLKSGILSPFYLDLRILVSYPEVLRYSALALAQILTTLKFDRIAAIPYAAIPIGTAIALEMNRPMIYPRREKKDYGTGRAIEGEFNAGETAVMIDDVITTGISKIETIDALVEARLKVRDIVVLVDREQGGVQELEARGFHVHAALKIRALMDTLKKAGKVSEQEYNEVLQFLAESK